MSVYLTVLFKMPGNVFHNINVIILMYLLFNLNYKIF